jgi:hypothetical protein
MSDIIKKKAGRPKGSPNRGDLNKTLMLKILKGIWSNPNGKPTEIINAADEYAVLMGWKLKKTESEGDNGNILSVEFVEKQEDKNKPPIKNIETKPVINIITKPVKSVETKVVESNVKSDIKIEIEDDKEPPQDVEDFLNG